MKKTTTIAFVTYKAFPQRKNFLKYPNLTISDNKVLEYLEEKGFLCKSLAWDDDTVNLDDYDSFIIRSSWNYYHSNHELENFLNFIHKIRSRIYNAEEIIRWNYHKKYLQDLENLDVPIVPTLIISEEKLILESFKKLENDHQCFVIKPSISGASRNTYLVYPFEDQQNFLSIKNKLKKSEFQDFLIQPFIRSILKDGEISCIFFRDTFSHSVRKIPSPHNYFYHDRISLIRVPPEALLLAKKALNAAYQILNLPNKTCLYARVDLLSNDKEGYFISELELIEPDLFLQYKKNGFITFADEIIRTLTYT